MKSSEAIGAIQSVQSKIIIIPSKMMTLIFLAR